MFPDERIKWLNCYSAKRSSLLLLFCCLSGLLQGQSPAQYLKSGDRAAQENNWSAAFSYYEQGYMLDTSSFELTRGYADAARQIQRAQLAETLYAKNYEKDNGSVNPDGLFWLAMMQKQNGKYEDAQRNFKKYVKKHKSTGNRDLIKRAAHESKSAVWAMDHLNQNKPDLPGAIKKPATGCASFVMGAQRLPDGINSLESEIAPLLVRDTFFYSVFDGVHWMMKSAVWKRASHEDKTDIEEWKQADFGSAESLQPNLKQSAANFVLYGNRVFYSQQESGSTTLWTALYDGEMLREMRALEALNDQGTNNTMPCVARIGGATYLFFSSDREGGEGGLDIWYTVDKNGWTKPKNAGSKINTEGDEITPFYDDGKLFFASNWYEGFGGQDIFSAGFNGTAFEKAENAGSIFNSSYNDFGYSKAVKDNTTWHFITSNRPVNPESDLTCCNDIYVIEEKKVCADNATVANESGELDSLMRELPVILYFHNDEPNPDSWDTTTTLSYLEAYHSYKKLLPRYIKENTKGLKGERLEDATEITNDFFELKVDKGLADLDMFAELLLHELQKGRSLNVAVRGFASPRAQTDYNLNLTKRRTASLVNFLRADSAGIFIPFIDDTSLNGARLTFTLLPFGEFEADKSVSDDLVDEKNSIYNRAACLERKIEIESVHEIASTLKRAELKMETDSFSFGNIGKYDEVKRSLRIDNPGNAILQIDSVIAECGCTQPHLDKNTVLPGDHATLEIGFHPFGSKDHVVKHVYIYVAGEEPKVITFEADIKK